ncbi:MAG: DUF4388 domain-containing protein [Acidobacteriota bacterium]|nr:DUF4388 domain-containing protein [Blastocatellia bacterium]MDW8413547.1 DUF4388 domain-containing protein [Acidobacteriota bacterium]
MQPCSNKRCSDPLPSTSGRCLTCNSLTIGKLVRDRYLVKEMVNRGGFGATYLIEDIDLFNERRILKELRPASEEGSETPTSKRRETAERLFLREADTLRKLNHKGIPKLYAYFIDEGFSYLVQEYIPGKTLIEEAEEKPFSERDARQTLFEIAEILDYLHSQQPPIIHRDVKPQNLMRHTDGRLMLIDFGAVCRAASQGQQRQTLIGSPGYAPPEQQVGRPVPQSDLYAAGATIVRLLTGIHPSQLTNHKTKQIEWDAEDYVSKEFAALINGLLVLDPQLRCPTAAVLISELKRLESVPCIISSERKNRSSAGQLATTTSLTQDRAESKHVQASLVTALRSITEVKEGSLSSTPVPTLLFRIYQKRMTGLLKLERKGAQKTITFQSGSIVFATSSLAEERLGEMLLQRGKISFAEYLKAEELMKLTGKRLASVLLQMGVLAQEEFVDTVIQHVSSIVYSVFGWTEGSYSFERAEQPDESIKMPFSTADIIFEGIRRIDDMELIKRWIGDFKRLLRTTREPRLLYQVVTPTPREAFIISRMDMAISVDELLSLGGLSEEETLKTICCLLSIGMLELADEDQPQQPPLSNILTRPAPLPQELDFITVAQFCREVEKKLASIETSDAYALLEIDRGATDRDVLEAYQKMARKFHPDRNSQLLNYNLRILDDLEKIFSAVAYAYEMLKTEDRRRQYDERLRTLGVLDTPSEEFTYTGTKDPSTLDWMKEENCERLIRIGRKHYEAGRYGDARMALEKAIRIDPRHGDAHFYLARTLSHAEGTFQLAEQSFRRAIDLEPDNADYYAEFGLFLQRFQLNDQAESLFRACLQLNPNHPVAKRTSRL